LALAQLTDEAVGYSRDNKYERSNLVRGITDTSQPHCRDAVASDEHRITRVGRAWMSRGWASGDGPKVYVHLDLVAYRDDKRAKAAVQELATVPKKCPKLISPSGGNREHYAEPVIDQPDLVAVVATVEHPNGVTTYEATYALAAAAVVSYLTVKTTDPDSIASLSRRLAQKVGVATGRAGARVAPLLRGATV
jgi:hypothetical protein